MRVLKLKKMATMLILLMLLTGVVTGTFGCGGGGGSGDTNGAANGGGEAEEGSGGSQGTQIIPFYTPSAGGTMYIVGAGIADIITRNVPGYSMNAEASGGSIPSITFINEQVAQGKGAMTALPSINAAQAYNGDAPFEDIKAPNLRGVNFVYGSEINLVVPANSPIQSIYDIKGHRISLNAPGSGVAIISEEIVNAHGMTVDDFDALWLSSTEIVSGIQDDSIDGGFIGASVPVPAITELSTSTDIRIISLDPEVVKKTVGERPYYYEAVIPGGTYKGVDEDVITMGYGVVTVAPEEMSEDFIYDFLTAIYDHRQELLDIHPITEQMTLEDATKTISIPLHPGAEKYFREKGVIK